MSRIVCEHFHLLEADCPECSQEGRGAAMTPGAFRWTDVDEDFLVDVMAGERDAIAAATYFAERLRGALAELERREAAGLIECVICAGRKGSHNDACPEHRATPPTPAPAEGPIRLPVRVERQQHLAALIDADGACIIRREDAAIVDQVAAALNATQRGGEGER